MENRITFYSTHDLAFSMEYVRIKERIKRLQNLSKPGLMDILELAQICRYLDTGNDSKKTSNSEKVIKKEINKWFSTISIDNLISEITRSSLSKQYEDELWERIALSKYSDNEVKKILTKYSDNKIVYPMRNKKIVKKYGYSILQNLIKYDGSAEIILSRKENGVTLPSELVENEEDKILTQYIDSKRPNPGFLKAISLDGTASYSVRLRALKKYSSTIEKHFQEHHTGRIGTEINVEITTDLNANQDYDVQKEENGSNIKLIIRFNGNHLLNLVDWPTILNNFEFIFGLINSDGILNMAPFTEQGGVLERILSETGTGMFPDNFTFKQLASIDILSFNAYYFFLQRQGIDLERIIEWFFNDYLVKNFKIEGLSISVVNAMSSSPELKTLNAMSQLHRIIRMYSLFSADKYFDRDLIDSFSDTPRFAEIGSIAHDKYIKVLDQGLVYAQYVLFSDQSPLSNSFEQNVGKSIATNNQKWSDFNEYQTAILDHLIRLHILQHDGKKLTFTDPSMYRLLHSSFTYGVIPTLKLDPFRNNKMLQKWSAKKMVIYQPTLLTPYESNLFDYYFSDKYPNGLGLRNKYAHGAFNSIPISMHRLNYMLCLLFIVLIILKIKNELDLNDRRNQ
ncbi:hypothetical protein [Schleiferilactobacillus perolens]|nr:hypothetical protein [Schleiferilactobacillus perolens]